MTTNDIQRIIVEIGRMAEDRIKTAETAEEKAFLFGHVNLAATLTSAIFKDNGTVKISLDYKNAFKAYKAAQEEHKEKIEKEETLEGQMDMDDIIPGLLNSLKEIKELLSEQNKTKEHVTYAVHSKKKPTNKE